MPKSKRAKIVHLTQTEKKGRQHKLDTYEAIRKAIDTWSFVYVISVNNMRNSFLKDIREEWKGKGRLFWGKNRVVSKSLGSSPTDSYLENSHVISSHLSGNVGLFFTDSQPSDVTSYFDNFEKQDYARGGTVSTETLILPSGPVMQGPDPLPPSMESQLRSLGVASLLKNGVVTLGKDHVICKEGQVITHEQARLLKMFYKQLAIFKVSVLGYWNAGEFTELMEQ